MRLLLVAVFLHMATVDVAACFCVTPAVPEAVCRSTAIFTGAVTAITSAPRPSPTSQERLERRKLGLPPLEMDRSPVRVHLVVNEAWRGIESPETEVFTGNGDCAYQFVVGESYLIYASTDARTRKLTTHLCSRNRRLTEAGEDLAYIRSLPRDGLGTRISGMVTQRAGETSQDWTHTPVANTTVVIENSTFSLQTVTDEKGAYEFRGLGPGQYRIYPLVPEPFEAIEHFGEHLVELEHRDQCREYHFQIRRK